MLRAFPTCDSRGQRLVLSDQETRDEMQITGRWIGCRNPVEVTP